MNDRHVSNLPLHATTILANLLIHVLIPLLLRQIPDSATNQVEKKKLCTLLILIGVTPPHDLVVTATR
jgi:hypothetical protein